MARLLLLSKLVRFLPSRLAVWESRPGPPRRPHPTPTKKNEVCVYAKVCSCVYVCDQAAAQNANAGKRRAFKAKISVVRIHVEGLLVNING